MNTAPIGFEPTGDVRSPAKHGAMLPAGKFSGNISGIVIEKKTVLLSGGSMGRTIPGSSAGLTGLTVPFPGQSRPAHQPGKG